MKFTSVLAFLTLSTVVTATPIQETNGQRMARGLPPLSPLNLNKRGTQVAGMPARSPLTIRYISNRSLPLGARRGYPSARSVLSEAKREDPLQ